MNPDVHMFSVNNLSKKYPGVQALKDISFSIKRGEVLGLVGENGAGKSTLIKIISGAIQKDEGELFLRGEVFNPSSPQKALETGIATIYQELSLVPGLNIACNLLLGEEPKLKRLPFFIDKKEMEITAKKILNELQIKNIEISHQLKNLSLAKQQMIEIARAISRKASLVLMDEPTSSLSNEDVKILFNFIKILKSHEISIIFISHRLNEVIEISDRILVMRDGSLTGSLSKHEFCEEKIIQYMVGREIELFPKADRKSGKKVLEVNNLCDRNLIKNISFHVKKGEIVGLAGLMGSGRSEVAMSIIGARPITDGQIIIEGQKVKVDKPSDSKKIGVVLIPEDRKLQGLVTKMSIKDNISLPILNQLIGFLRIIKRKLQKGLVNKYISSLSIVTTSLDKPVNMLSGGNQQKVVISKWLSTNPKVLIMDEPTRGIDVGAKSEVHRLMNKLVAEGLSILMISSEMPEILGMSDRIIVMCQGRITGELSRKDASEEKIMTLATMFS